MFGDVAIKPDPERAEDPDVATRVLTLRRNDHCVSCADEVLAGTRAIWDPAARTVTCLNCTETTSVAPSGPEPLDRGEAGASAGREYNRRKAFREQKIRSQHPHLGGVILALSDEPKHQSAWDRGRSGEEAVAEALERRTAESATILLHDRRMPRNRGNIDHLAISPSGVYVIDAKNVAGKVSVRTPWFGKSQLIVSGRDRTELIDKLENQVEAVRELLTDRDAPPVQGVLCFTRAELPLLGTTRMRGHLLLYRKALAKRLSTDGPFDAGRIDEIARRLAGALPGA